MQRWGWQKRTDRSKRTMTREKGRWGPKINKKWSRKKKKRAEREKNQETKKKKKRKKSNLHDHSLLSLATKKKKKKKRMPLWACHWAHKQDRDDRVLEGHPNSFSAVSDTNLLLLLLLVLGISECRPERLCMVDVPARPSWIKEHTVNNRKLAAAHWCTGPWKKNVCNQTSKKEKHDNNKQFKFVVILNKLKWVAKNQARSDK